MAAVSRRANHVGDLEAELASGGFARVELGRATRRTRRHGNRARARRGIGDGPATTQSDIVGPAIATEDMFKFSSLNPGMGPTIRRLAKLAPRTLALMHGPSFNGDTAAALGALADDYDRRIRAAI